MPTTPPSRELFRQPMKDNLSQALKNYVVHVDATTREGNTERLRVRREQDIAFVFQSPNLILMRPRLETEIQF